MPRHAFINRPPTNAELDLRRYATVATTAKIARDVVEVYSFAAMSASARIAKMLDGPFVDGRALAAPSALEGVERATPELLERVRGHGRKVVIAESGSDDLRFLDHMNAEVAVGGADLTHILLRPNPSKVAALEEFLHGTQQRLRMIDRIGRQAAGVEVKDFMIRHAKMLNLCEEDVAILRILRERELDILRAMQRR